MLVKSIEGVLWGLAAYCGAEVIVPCRKCGEEIDFVDVLAAQNLTTEHLDKMAEVARSVDMEIREIGRNFSQEAKLRHLMEDQNSEELMLFLQYDELLQEVDQLLYW